MAADGDAGSSSSPGPGGFFQEQLGADLVSPSPSVAVNSARARTAAGLPHPRSRALPSGSSKENLVRRYASERILNINRRFIKKYSITDPSDTVVGYKSMGELCADVDVVLNSLWKSGTPNLQIQYLLNIASELITWMDGFAPSPRATLAILRKLDYCFASLLGGEDLETHELLPGFEQGVRRAGMTQTDMVRCRSIAEQSRITVVDVFQRGPPDPLDEGDRASIPHTPRSSRASRAPRAPRTPRTPRTPTPNSINSTNSPKTATLNTFKETLTDTDTETESRDTDTETETPPRTATRETTAEPGLDEDAYPEYDNDDDDMDEDEQMGVARVYEHTLVKLGQALGEGYGRIGDFGPPAQPAQPAQPCASNPANEMELDIGENDDDEY